MEEITEGVRKKLTLTEEEKEGLLVEEDEEDDQNILEEEIERSLIGTLLTGKNYKRDYMKSTMVEAWRLKGKVEIRDIGKNLFAFIFDRLEDKTRVMEKGPWNFENSLLLLENTMRSINPRNMIFNEAIFWIQIHNLPLMAMKKSILLKIGDRIGKVVDIEENKGGIKWGTYLRIRVRVNIKKPLMRGCMITFPQMGEIWAQFKYERLPRYCRWCGILGHTEYGCEHREETGNGEYRDLRAENDIMNSKSYEPKKSPSFTSAINQSEEKNKGKTGEENTENSRRITIGEKNYNGKDVESGESFINNNTAQMSNREYENLELMDTATSPIKKTREKNEKNGNGNREEEGKEGEERTQNGTNRREVTKGKDIPEKELNSKGLFRWKRRARVGNKEIHEENTIIRKRKEGIDKTVEERGESKRTKRSEGSLTVEKQNPNVTGDMECSRYEK